MDWHQQLTKHQLSFFTSYSSAENYIRAIEPPKCKELFLTVIEGIQYRTSNIVAHKRV